MSDPISRQAAIYEITEYGSGDTIYMSVAELKRRIEHLPSAEPEIIYCRDCKNHIDERCIEADHHTSDNECCMSVFHAERRTDD